MKLVTAVCWRLYTGDSFEMLLVTFSLFWWLFQFTESVTNISNRISVFCHQHQPSTTSVNNINVTAIGNSVLLSHFYESWVKIQCQLRWWLIDGTNRKRTLRILRLFKLFQWRIIKNGWYWNGAENKWLS